MSFVEVSKREHCPQCDGTRMYNYLLVRPGVPVEVFVECAECGAFTARYTLSAYTDDPYRSCLRQMRTERRSSGAATHKTFDEFRARLQEDYRKARTLAREREETRSVEDLLDDIE